MATAMSTEESGVARAALVAGVFVVALVLGVALLALTPDADRLPPGGRLVPVFTVVVGWSFAGLGGFAAWRRPDNPTGALLAAFGLAALLSGMAIADARLPYLVSRLADALALPLFVHLLLSFASGRVEDRASRWVVAASYVSAAVPQVVAMLVGDPAGEPSCGDCPDNPILIASHDGVAEAALAVKSTAGLALALAAVVLVVRRARVSSPFQRRAFAPLATAGAVLLVLVVVSVTAQAVNASDAVQKAAQLVFIAGFVGLPVAFLIGLQRSRFFRSATVTAVIDRLAVGRGAHDLEGDLAAALGDPSLAVAYWLPEGEEYVDREGHPMTLPAQDAGSVVTEITHQGRRVGALVHDGTLSEDSELMRAVAGAAGLALENERLEVELRARLQALRASRARIVAVGDAERRRLGRDLHDGAQQRLISLLLDLQLARERWEEDPGSSRELVDHALESARAAVEELRDLASGIHPAVLSQRGLDAALESLATRSPVPVELDVVLDERLPSATETAAYFVVAEALTNVAKYAEATYASVVVRRENGAAVVEVRDDGVGGADAAGGTGLLGLSDRVGALDGTIELVSPRGEGTVVRARIPLAP
jgi:signal transduction histidine kinase